MSNYTLVNVSFTGRTELHDLLKLTGTEISINTLPAGANVPFVHQHTKNEEVYIIIEGQGLFYIDGEEKPVQKGDCLRIAPKGARGIAAAKDASALLYLRAGQGGQPRRLHHARRCSDRKTNPAGSANTCHIECFVFSPRSLRRKRDSARKRRLAIVRPDLYWSWCSATSILRSTRRRDPACDACRMTLQTAS